MKQFLIGALLAAALCVMSTQAQAQSQDPVSDSLTVFDQNHNIFSQVSITESVEDSTSIYFINDPTLANATQYGNATTLIEGDSSASDIFGVVSFDGGQTLFLGFNSDTETQAAAFGDQGAIFLPEGNGVFDATQYLNDNLQAQGFTAQFISDPNEITPEPASAAVIGFGALGVAGMVLARRRKSLIANAA